jgi:hypothetical protein
MEILTPHEQVIILSFSLEDEDRSSVFTASVEVSTCRKRWSGLVLEVVIGITNATKDVKYPIRT